VVAQGVATRSTINRIEAGLAGFYGDFGVYPPSDGQHEAITSDTALLYGYQTLGICLGGPEGTGWGAGAASNKMPFGGTSTEKFGPYFEGTTTDSYKPAKPILYFRYEQSEVSAYDFNDNKDVTKGEDGFFSQGNLDLLVKRRGSGQYVRRDYVLISAGPDRVFGYRKGPDASGNYTFPTSSYEGAYCDDVTNFKYEQY